MAFKLYCYKALVRRVVDGDTLEVDLDLGFKIHQIQMLRLAGLNAPEITGVPKDSEDYKKGLATKDFLKELVEGKFVFMRSCSLDKYGRSVATLWLIDLELKLEVHGQCVNTLLLEKGLASPYMGKPELD